MDNYIKNKNELDKFNSWRRKKAKEMPTIAARVFVLRKKNYNGHGFHYSLEKELGWAILTMNDFNNKNYDQCIKRITVESKYEHFISWLEEIENSIKEY